MTRILKAQGQGSGNERESRQLVIKTEEHN